MESTQVKERKKKGRVRKESEKDKNRWRQIDRNRKRCGEETGRGGWKMNYFRERAKDRFFTVHTSLIFSPHSYRRGINS